MLRSVAHRTTKKQKERLAACVLWFGHMDNVMDVDIFQATNGILQDTKT
jgi:hypothetical protein